MHQAEIIVLLFATVAVLAVLAHKITLPYPIVLVVGGLALSFVSQLPAVNLNPDIFFYFILPALIYPAALFTSWRDFRRNLRPILLLAIGLVLATMLVVAWIAHSIVPALPWAAAFALGAIVSPPDAVAATAIIRRLSVPHRVQVILEGESLALPTGRPFPGRRLHFVCRLFADPGHVGVGGSDATGIDSETPCATRC